jgi:uncharacterized protein (DUF58 family)
MTSTAAPLSAKPAASTTPTPVQAPVGSFFIPTGKFYQWLLLGSLIPLAATFLPKAGLSIGFLGMLVYDLVVLGVAIFDFRQACQWQLRFKRNCEERLSIGRDNLIQIGITATAKGSAANSSRRAKLPPTLLQLREHVSEEFRVDQTTLAYTLQPDTETELTYHVFPPRRGKFTWQKLDCRLLSPRGLIWRTWQQPLRTAVEVYPDLIGLRSLSVRLSLEATGSLRRRRHALGGTEFSELREYSLGDDLRMIDWKATARRGHPLVRLMEPERDQPLIILLDRGRLMTAKVAGLKRFDWALNATLSLALAGLRRGDRVGVCIFDNDIHTWIAPQGGQSQLGRILEQVYNVEPAMVESDYIGTVSSLLNRYPRRALVVLLTDIVDQTASAELLAAMGQLTPRYLPFCVAIRDPLVDQLAGQPLETSLQAPALADQVQNLYEQGVALDLMQQRHVAFAKVKQKGVLVLDAPANNISELLVDRYLLLKARGQL